MLPLALAMTRYLVCETPGETDACGRCKSCRLMDRLEHPDVYPVLPIFSKKKGGEQLLSVDFLPEFRQAYDDNPYLDLSQWESYLAAENKQLMIPIAEVRDLQRRIHLKHFGKGYKVVLVWRTDLMNREAANAFLKLLEEPPPRTILILTAPVSGRLLTTITSRTQLTTLLPLTPEDIRGYLEATFQTPPEQAEEAAFLADGNLNAALKMLSQGSTSYTEVFQQWMRICYKGDLAEIQEFSQEVGRETKEYLRLLLQLAGQRLRDAYISRVGANALVTLPEKEEQFVQRFGVSLPQSCFEPAERKLEAAAAAIKQNANARIVLTTLSLELHQLFRRG